MQNPKILNGKKIAEKILKGLGQKIKIEGSKLKLAVVLVGNDPASVLFVRKKKQAGKKIGIGFKLYQFPAGISQKALEGQIKKIAENSKVSGMIIQLPLPKNIDTEAILNLVPLKKDVDCLGQAAVKKLKQGKLLILPPVVGAIKKILDDYKIKLKGKKVLIVGKGRLVGQPLISWLPKQGAKILTADKFTENLTGLCRKSDIIISGVGKPGLINGKMIKEGVVIIDVGSCKKNGRITGDVDFKSCIKKARGITPVPGGVGPLTVACLLENLVKLNNAKGRRS